MRSGALLEIECLVRNTHFILFFFVFPLPQSELSSGVERTCLLPLNNEQVVPFLRVSGGGGRRAAVRGGPGRSVQLVVQVSSRRTGHGDPRGRLELQTVRGGRQVRKI